MHPIDLAIFDQPVFAEARRGRGSDRVLISRTNQRGSVFGFWSWLASIIGW